MEKYGVLIVDDSAVMRKKIGMKFDGDINFEVIGKARNGIEALEKINLLKPDLVIMDVDMPVLNGFEALRIQMQRNPLPIIMISDELKDEKKATQYNASYFFVKTHFLSMLDFSLEMFIEIRRKLLEYPLKHEDKQMLTYTSPRKMIGNSNRILIIGSSTGGPSALQTILTSISSSFYVPIVLIQHMPAGFTKPLADRFNEICPFRVKEIEHDEILKDGIVYIAPAGVQTLFKQSETGLYQVSLVEYTEYQTLYKPSIDVSLISIAELAKNQILTVVLTGMGNDGLKGCREVKSNGGRIVVESEETCVVYGMPKVIQNEGLADKQLPLYNIAKEIEDFLRK